MKYYTFDFTQSELDYIILNFEFKLPFFDKCKTEFKAESKSNMFYVYVHDRRISMNESYFNGIIEDFISKSRINENNITRIDTINILIENYCQAIRFLFK